MSTPSRPAPRPPDWDRGSTFLLLFVAATMIVVGDIWLVGAVGQMWILIPAMALDLLVTFAVLVAITRLLRDDAGPDGGHGVTVGSSGSHQP